MMGDFVFPGPAQLLSKRGHELQSERAWAQVVDIISDIYDKEHNPNGYVSLGLAENRLMHEELINHINTHVQFKLTEHLLTYADGGTGTKDLCKAVSKFLAKYLKSRTTIDAEHVLCFPGVTVAIEGIVTMIADPGDGILLGRPYYGSFLIDMGLRARVKAVTVSFGDVDPFSIEAVDVYEQALRESEQAGVKIRGIMLCSPHNPLGRCYPANVLVAFLKLCQKYQIHLISDEIYALSVWHNRDHPDAVGFTSVMEIDSAELIDPNLVHVLWGVSKDFGANGLRLGCAVVRNEPLRIALLAYSNFTFCSTSSDKIVTNLLADSSFVESFVKENQRRLSIAYARTVDFLGSKSIRYYSGSNAAFFVWAELRSTYLGKRNRSTEISLEDGEKIDDEIYNELLDNRVFIGKGQAYGGELGGWFRIVFSHPHDYLDLGLQKMWEVIGAGEG